MSVDLSATGIAIIAAAVLALVGYIAFILIPAVVSYRRIWERIAAGFLTLFMLATLIGMGAALGLAIVWSYDRYA